jgi:tetratricopeptide (TPR) repeat protein
MGSRHARLRGRAECSDAPLDPGRPSTRLRAGRPVRPRPRSGQPPSPAAEARLAEIRRLRDLAEHAVDRGRYAEALAACQRLEHLQPAEPAWARRSAYCLGRLGRAPEQVAALRRAAQTYERAGFLTKAGAMYRLALAIAPRDEELARRAAELHAGRVRGLEGIQGLQYYTPSELPPPTEASVPGEPSLVDEYDVVEFTDPEIEPV